ncbi:UDP-glycosyltransferase 73C2 isoform X2 [Cucumis sativus]|uniref:UDP-glycosyltransferase 73C2 isoform X2 n=1 Tax=Cucumis sativus TaxID=3659 RepID=UPI0002B42663|nr:UDP-glycosyltransferase 73C2 isoform X2 [Cucumis sativus]
MASSKSKQSLLLPHFLLFPVMAQGHQIPMAELAKLLSQSGVKTTLITTPQNATRIQSLLSQSPLTQIIQLPFPSHQQHLLQNCENFDSLPSLHLLPQFLTATSFLYSEIEHLFPQLSPKPCCIVSDMALPWTIQIAHKFNVPRLVFYSLSAFYLLFMATLRATDFGEKIMAASDYELISIPNFPDSIQVTKSQLVFTLDPVFLEWGNQMAKADRASYGFIMNSFNGLEPKYLEEFKKTIDKVWCIGPVSLCNKDTKDKAKRGNKAAIDEQECMKWLDKQESESVIYAALGSICNVIAPQIIELGLALEASNKPFIWVIRQTKSTKKEVENWLAESEFEQRIKDRGLVIRGWAPQVLILSHPAVGGFVTHCGWNSTIEGISMGVPMVTWPLFSDQTFNEKLIVEVLRIGVSVGVEKCLRWGVEEEIGVQVKKEAIRGAIEKVMSGEGEEMRKRVRELAAIAKATMEEGGSSHLNLKRLIEEIMHQADSQQSQN